MPTVFCIDGPLKGRNYQAPGRREFEVVTYPELGHSFSPSAVTYKIHRFAILSRVFMLASVKSVLSAEEELESLDLILSPEMKACADFMSGD